MSAGPESTLDTALADDAGDFANLVCDTILYEWSRTCMHYNSFDPLTHLVRVDHAQFAKWFRITIDTCAKFHRFFKSYYFDTLLRKTGLQEASMVKVRFDDPSLGLRDFFPRVGDNQADPLEQCHQLNERKDSFLIPLMNDVEDDGTGPRMNLEEEKFLQQYCQMEEKYQQMLALIMSTLFKKWRSDALDREPCVVYLGHKVLYRLMPAYTKVLREAYQSQGTIKPPTPREEYTKSMSDLEEKRRAEHARQSNMEGTSRPGGPPPMYDLYGTNAALKRYPAEGVNWQDLTKLVTQYYLIVKSSRAAEERRSHLIRRIQSILNKEFPADELRVEAFGSAAIGLGSENSDLDLCITTPHFDKKAPYNDMTVLRKLFIRNRMRKVIAITSARVPIVKFEDPVTRIKVDINCNHVLGVHNSQLIKTYMHIDPRLSQMLYVLKALIKIHGIHDSSQGLLSSYTVVMMAIGFLQEQMILPNLQNQTADQMTQLRVQMDHDGTGGRDLIDCTFDRDWRRHEGYGADIDKPLAQLLFEFFELFARDFNYPEWEVNIRLGGLCRRGGVPLSAISDTLKIPAGRRRRAEFVVMDPFLRQRNVAGTCLTKNLPHVWAVFNYLYEKLSKGDWDGALKRMPWPLHKIHHEHSIKGDNQPKDAATTAVSPAQATFTATSTTTITTTAATIVTAPAPVATASSSLTNDSSIMAHQPNGQPRRSRRHKDKDATPQPHQKKPSKATATKTAKVVKPPKPVQAAPNRHLKAQEPHGTLSKQAPSTTTPSLSSSLRPKQKGKRLPRPPSTTTSHAPEQIVGHIGCIGYMEYVEDHHEPPARQTPSHHPKQKERRSVPLTSPAAMVTASLASQK